MEALGPFLLCMIPVWFVFSLIKLIKYQGVVSNTAETMDRASAVKYRNAALISLVLSAIVIALIFYVLIQMAGIQC